MKKKKSYTISIRIFCSISDIALSHAFLTGAQEIFNAIFYTKNDFYNFFIFAIDMHTPRTKTTLQVCPVRHESHNASSLCEHHPRSIYIRTSSLANEEYYFMFYRKMITLCIRVYSLLLSFVHVYSLLDRGFLKKNKIKNKQNRLLFLSFNFVISWKQYKNYNIKHVFLLIFPLPGCIQRKLRSDLLEKSQRTRDDQERQMVSI